MRRIVLSGLFLFAIPALESPGSWSDAATIPSRAAADKTEAPTMVSAGDALSIAVFPVEEYSRELTVQPDGRIEMPLIGSILVKGLSTGEIQELLQKRYSGFISNPKIAVNVRHFAGRRVAILGEMRSAGFYDYRDGMTILELVSNAGGFAEFPMTSKIWVLRRGLGGSNRSFRINYNKVLKGDLSRDVSLQPGDVVYVPKQPVPAASSWITANVLPWAFLTSSVFTIILADRALRR